MYGRILRELRTEKNLSQKQLAELLNTKTQTISKYELEQLDLSTDLIIKICEIFEVSSDYLFRFKRRIKTKK